MPPHRTERLPSGKMNVHGPVNPNVYVHHPWDPVQKYDQRLHYDAYNLDVNRQANKAYNNMTHIRFLGAGRPATDPELERLREVQRNLTNRQMLEDQIREGKDRKQLQKLARKREEEEDNARVKREQEVMDRRDQMEKQKQVEKIQRYQADK